MAKEYLIGDFLKRIKRPIQLIDDQEYKLVTIKMNHNGVVLREHKKGALIKSKMYEVKKGDFILSGIDARNGAFGIVPPELDGAIVTNDFWYFEIDANIIAKRLFLELTATTWFDEICKRGSDGTTQRIRLQKNKFFNQSVMLPEGNEQKVLLDKILSFKSGQSKLESEIQTQKLLTTQLKKSILQEAIQGKLTADWRAKRAQSGAEVEPASELLKCIKAEKAQLIKDKKIKKEKPLPPIKAADIPFELPEGWVWCRIQDISTLKSGNSYNYAQGSENDILYVKVGDMNIPGNFDDVTNSSNYFVYQDSMQKDLINPKSIIFPKRGGAIATNKRCNVLSKKILIDSNSMAIIPSKYIDFEFFSWWFKTIDLSTFGNEAVVPQVNNKDILPIPFPLAPFKEQNSIVEKVEALMQKCQALEDEIRTSEINTQMLMQAVLKEAFEGKQEVVEI